MAEDANTLRSINDLVIALIGNPLLLLLGSTAWSDGSTIVGAIVTRCSERARATALIARRDELRRVRRLLGRSVGARGRYLRYRDCDRRHAGWGSRTVGGTAGIGGVGVARGTRLGGCWLDHAVGHGRVAATAAATAAGFAGRLAVAALGLFG